MGWDGWMGWGMRWMDGMDGWMDERALCKVGKVGGHELWTRCDGPTLPQVLHSLLMFFL